MGAGRGRGWSGRRSVSLIQVIVALVVVAALAATAVVSNRKVVVSAADRAAAVELRAAARAGGALIAQRRDGDLTLFNRPDLVDAINEGDPPGVPVTEDADRLWALASGDSSQAHGWVSVEVSSDGTTAGWAMRSRSGRCVTLVVTGGPGRVADGTVTYTDAADCSADGAVGGGVWAPTATGGDTTVTVTFSALVDPTVTGYTVLCWTPEVNLAGSETITDPARWSSGTVVSVIVGLENHITHTCRVDTIGGTPPASSTTVTAVPTTTTGDLASHGQPDPVPEPWLPQGAPAGSSRTLDNEDPHDSAGIPDTSAIGDLWGVTSWPSTHPSPPHRLYVTDHGTGALLVVTDNGVSGTVARTVMAAGTFNGPTAVISGPSPAHDLWDPDQPTWDVLYVAEQTTGSIIRVDPRAGTRVTVGGGFNQPTGLAGFACYDRATDTRTGGVCLLVADADGIHQLNLTTGMVDWTLNLGARRDVTVTTTGGTVGAWVTVTGTGGAVESRTVADEPLGGGGPGSPTVLTSVLWDRGTDHVFAGDSTGTIWRIHQTTGAATQVVTGLGGEVRALHDHLNTPVIYATTPGCVHAVDTSAGTARTVWCDTYQRPRVVGVASDGGASGQATLPAPSGAAPGDLLVATVTEYTAGDLPSWDLPGWRWVGARQNGYATTVFWWRVADGTEAPVTVTTGGDPWVTMVVTVAGADTTDPIRQLRTSTRVYDSDYYGFKPWLPAHEAPPAPSLALWVNQNVRDNSAVPSLPGWVFHAEQAATGASVGTRPEVTVLSRDMAASETVAATWFSNAQTDKNLAAVLVIAGPADPVPTTPSGAFGWGSWPQVGASAPDGWWTFDDTSGTTVTDTGSAGWGALAGAVSPGWSQPPLVDDTTAPSATVTDAYTSTAGGLVSQGPHNTRTLSVWLRTPDDDGAPHQLVDLGSANRGVGIWWQSGTLWVGAWGTGGPSGVDDNVWGPRFAGVVVPERTTTQVVVTFDRTLMGLWVAGTRVGSWPTGGLYLGEETLSVGAVDGTTRRWVGGAPPLDGWPTRNATADSASVSGPDPWGGRVDELMVFDRVLSPAEIADLWTAGADDDTIGAPQNVRILGRGELTGTVTWDGPTLAPVDAHGTAVWVDGVFVDAQPRSTHTVTGAAPGESHTVHVATRTARGDSTQQAAAFTTTRVPTVVGTTAKAGSSSTISLTVPAGGQSGDLVIVTVSRDAGTNPPGLDGQPGWTQLGSTTSVDTQIWAFWAAWDPSMDSGLSFSRGGGSYWSATVTVVRYGNPAGARLVGTAVHTSGDRDIPWPAWTVTGPDSPVVLVMASSHTWRKQPQSAAAGWTLGATAGHSSLCRGCQGTGVFWRQVTTWTSQDAGSWEGLGSGANDAVIMVAVDPQQ